uniref:Uncharacterized protein MANES_02G028100 n=1 Tax=Rhizophora mucronata TaxID=61149 RepID=A0A2P2P3P0_RHIMU
MLRKKDLLPNLYLKRN